LKGKPTERFAVKLLMATKPSRSTAHPHLTIMDFNVPGLDGWNASREILRKKPDAPILMVSVFASQQLADEAKKAGIQGFCPKSEAECIIEAVECYCAAKSIFRRSCTEQLPLIFVH
jgi:DNA-binding NarL/FixJ family response regulator